MPEASRQYYRHLAAPTVTPFPAFSADADAEALKKAMKGAGCDEKVVTNILCSRSNAQRQQIKQAYKLKFGEDLIKELKSELKGGLEDFLVALMFLPDEYDASELYKAMKGLGTDEATLVEILSTRTNSQIRAIKSAYQRLYEKELEKMIGDDTSGALKSYLIASCNGARDESYDVNDAKAKQQAKILQEGGAKKVGDDENDVNQIVTQQNFQQLKALISEYRRLAKQDLEETVEKSLNGDTALAVLTPIKVARGKEKYFVDRLVQAMKKSSLGGADDKTLIRILVSRSEIDLLTICQEYERQYANSLSNAIAGSTSGKYKDALLTLLQNNSTSN